MALHGELLNQAVPEDIVVGSDDLDTVLLSMQQKRRKKRELKDQF
jgi:hypothetical protein